MAKKQINCSFVYFNNVKQCEQFIYAPYHGEDVVKITNNEIADFQSRHPDEIWTGANENKYLIALISDKLIPFQRIIFHSVGIYWRKQAWLITAPSGVGKTTQYQNLKQLYGEEIQIICGDNPVLHFQGHNIIRVYPSPWNGKENYSGNLEGDLAGIILLTQERKNKIYKVSPEEAVIPIFQEINTYARTPELVHQMFQLEEKLITSVPVWKFENNGTLESSRMLMDSLRNYVEKELQDEV